MSRGLGDVYKRQESVVHEEIRYTTKELNEFANSFQQKCVGMDFKGVG